MSMIKLLGMDVYWNADNINKVRLVLFNKGINNNPYA